MEGLTPEMIQEALFLYNAVNDGWTVRKGEDGDYKFEKDRSQLKDLKKLEHGKYDRKFIERYLRTNVKGGGDK